MTPRIIARYFSHGPVKKFDRLASVLVKSARRHCPTWRLDIDAMPFAPMASPRGLDHNCYNTQKLEAWADAVERAADGDRLLLMDADTVILHSLDDLWNEPFDFAYTVKLGSPRMPLNAGVIAVRVSAKTRAFMRLWQTADRFLFENPREQNVWLPAFGGMNQCSLGMLFSKNDAAKPEQFRGLTHGLTIRRLECVTWNCEDESWARFDPDTTRIVHVKGDLRRAIFGDQVATPGLRPLVDAWRAMEGLRLAEHAEIPHEPPIDTDDKMIRPEDLHTVDPPVLRTPEDGIEIVQREDQPVPTRKARRAAARRMASSGGADAIAP